MKRLSSTWKTALCETNGISIHYTRTGGDKPPMVLLHGLAADGACWTALARALAEEFDVIMPDARGHGKSTAPDHGYRYEDHANDVVGLFETLGLSRPILVGHSMGGMTAAVVASRKPKGLRALILADPTFLTPKVQREVWESDVTDKHRRLLDQSFDEVVNDVRTRHPHRSLESSLLIARARLQTSLSAFDVLTPPSPELKTLIPTIEVPSLLVIAETGVVTPSVAEDVRHMNPRFRVQQIREAGHGLQFDRPEELEEVVKSFARSLA